MRVELTGRLGVAWQEHRPGVFDLICIPTDVREAFSKRSAQVEAKLADLVRRWSAEHGGAEPDPRTIAGLERAAALAPRPGKTNRLDP